jgi:hypothetical protein
VAELSYTGEGTAPASVCPASDVSDSDSGICWNNETNDDLLLELLLVLLILSWLSFESMSAVSDGLDEDVLFLKFDEEDDDTPVVMHKT